MFVDVQILSEWVTVGNFSYFYTKDYSDRLCMILWKTLFKLEHLFRNFFLTKLYNWENRLIVHLFNRFMAPFNHVGPSLSPIEFVTKLCRCLIVSILIAEFSSEWVGIYYKQRGLITNRKSVSLHLVIGEVE